MCKAVASPSRSQAVGETVARQTLESPVERRPEGAPQEVEAVLPNETGNSPIEMAQVVNRTGSSAGATIPAKVRTQGRNEAETEGAFGPGPLVERGAETDATEGAPGSDWRSAPPWDVPYLPSESICPEEAAPLMAAYQALIQAAAERR